MPDDITVTVDGNIVPRDPSHQRGWDYTSTTLTSIQLYGAWCEHIHGVQSYEIDVYYGCPN